MTEGVDIPVQALVSPVCSMHGGHAYLSIIYGAMVQDFYVESLLTWFALIYSSNPECADIELIINELGNIGLLLLTAELNQVSQLLLTAFTSFQP